MLQAVVQLSGALEDSGRPLLGFETLTLAPLDARLIDVALLNAEERKWVDAYHARIWHEISPHLSEGERSWLEAATRPLSC